MNFLKKINDGDEFTGEYKNWRKSRARGMRKRIFQIIEVASESDILSKIYDVTMMVVIIMSLIPSALKSTGGVIGIQDYTVFEEHYNYYKCF